MIRVHAASLELARREREAAEATRTSALTDAHQCRIRLDEAQREIDRLNRGARASVAPRAPQVSPAAHAARSEWAASSPCSTGPAAPLRRGDAPRLSERPARTDDAPPPPIVIALPQLIMIGSLLDLLA